MTFAEFEKLPRKGQAFPYELRNGEVFELSEPTVEHKRAQRRIRQLLEQAAREDWIVESEVAFRGLPDIEYRVADVAAISRSRWDAAVRYFFGAPDLVVEVLSPSNTVSEMRDKAALCLQHGSREFWLVDIDR